MKFHSIFASGLMAAVLVAGATSVTAQNRVKFDYWYGLAGQLGEVMALQQAPDRDPSLCSAGFPGTILSQPFETYAVKKKVKWTPHSFFFMDLRSDNLSFA